MQISNESRPPSLLFRWCLSEGNAVGLKVKPDILLLADAIFDQIASDLNTVKTYFYVFPGRFFVEIISFPILRLGNDLPVGT